MNNSTPFTIKSGLNPERTSELLKFIDDTRNGKFTAQKPDSTQVRFQRIEIQEQDKIAVADDNAEECLLFGISR